MFLFKEIWKLSANWRNFFLSVGILFIWMSFQIYFPKFIYP